MTNEEKAKEICGGNFIAFNKEFSAALQMAEWKDQQFKEYLEKKEQEYEIERGTLRFSGDVIEKIINELFKREE